MTTPAAFGAANTARVAAAGRRDAERLRAALDAAGGGCPELWRRVAEARIAAPGEPWTVLAPTLGMTKDEAYGHYRRLLALARDPSAVPLRCGCGRVIRRIPGQDRQPERCAECRRQAAVFRAGKAEVLRLLEEHGPLPAREIAIRLFGDRCRTLSGRFRGAADDAVRKTLDGLARSGLAARVRLRPLPVLWAATVPDPAREPAAAAPGRCGVCRRPLASAVHRVKCGTGGGRRG